MAAVIEAKMAGETDKALVVAFALERLRLGQSNCVDGCG